MVAGRDNGSSAPTDGKTKLVIAEDQALLAGILPDLLHRASSGSNESIRTQLLKARRGDVLRLLLEGFSPNEIADMLPVGKKYVDKKIAEVKSILGVKTHIRILRACIELRNNQLRHYGSGQFGSSPPL